MTPVADLITTGDVAQLYGVSNETIRRWAETGLIPSVRMPSGRRKFSRTEIERRVAELTGGEATA